MFMPTRWCAQVPIILHPKDNDVALSAKQEKKLLVIASQEEMKQLVVCHVHLVNFRNRPMVNENAIDVLGIYR